MGSEIISEADAVELERILIVLDRLGETGAKLAGVARRATAAILDVVAAASPAEVEVEWQDDEAA